MATALLLGLLYPFWIFIFIGLLFIVFTSQSPLLSGCTFDSGMSISLLAVLVSSAFVPVVFDDDDDNDVDDADEEVEDEEDDDFVSPTQGSFGTSSVYSTVTSSLVFCRLGAGF